VKAEKERIDIPKAAERKLLVESGHKCSAPFCNESDAISIHHINGDPSDNKESNLIVLCRNHHAMADSGKIDRKKGEERVCTGTNSHCGWRARRELNPKGGGPFLLNAVTSPLGCVFLNSSS
jgi:hypothetical protein